MTPDRRVGGSMPSRRTKHRVRDVSLTLCAFLRGVDAPQESGAPFAIRQTNLPMHKDGRPVVAELRRLRPRWQACQQTESDGAGVLSPKRARPRSPTHVPASAASPQIQPERLPDAI